MIDFKVDGQPNITYDAVKPSLETVRLKSRSFLVKMTKASLLIDSKNEYKTDLVVVKSAPDCQFVKEGEIVSIQPGAVPIWIEFVEGNFLIFEEYLVLASYPNPKDKRNMDR